MNAYFLVEGSETETTLYPKWLSSLVPNMSQVKNPSAAINNNYFIISGMGYPSVLQHIENSIADINDIGVFDFFVISIDAEDETPETRINEINTYISASRVKLSKGTEIVIVIQNKCIESWLLGNDKIFKRTPSNATLQRYISHYDVSLDDPESCPNNGDYNTCAQFHHSYLKLIFRERNISYQKGKPGSAASSTYLNALKRRAEKMEQMPTFTNFLSLCERLNKLSTDR